MDKIAFIYTILMKAINDDITPEKAIELIRSYLSL